MRLRIALAAYTFVLLTTGMANADFLTYHASAGAGGRLFTDLLQYQKIFGSNNPGVGLGSFASKGISTAGETANGSVRIPPGGIAGPPPSPAGSVSEAGTATASAAAAESGFVLSTSASYGSGNIELRQYQGSVQATAFWQDVLFLSNVDPQVVGHVVRLNFSEQGVVSGSSHAENQYSIIESSVANSAYGTNRMVVEDPRHPTDGLAGAVFGLASAGSQVVKEFDDTIRYSGMDSISLSNDGTFTATWHLDIPILPNQGFLNGIPGSIYFLAIDQSVVDGTGAGSGYAADPFGLVSITLPDMGNVTPESLGVNLTFDSGISSPNLGSNSVPEPSSLVLIAGFGLMAAGKQLRRWRPTFGR